MLRATEESTSQKNGEQEKKKKKTYTNKSIAQTALLIDTTLLPLC